MTNVKQLIASMMTENTGSHMCDSGGESGRMWQRHAGMTVADFEARPEATIQVDADGDCEITVDLFHKLTCGLLELDDLCNEFNAIEVGTWNGTYYGTCFMHDDFLEREDMRPVGEVANSYNFDNNLSQVIQAQEFECYHGTYLLLQIHNGADVRGGYTDAKLFRVDDHHEAFEVFSDDCGVSIEDPRIGDQRGDRFTGHNDDKRVCLDWHGELISRDGCSASDDDIALFHKLSQGQPVSGMAYGC